MTRTTSNENLLAEFLGVLAGEYNKGRFMPLLESDVVSYLYMLWVSEKRDASNAHVNTRLCHVDHEKYDFVIGNVDRCCDVRPCIAHAELVIEVKAFPIGFKKGQPQTRYKAVKKDIERLARLNKIVGERYILLFDEKNYLDKPDKESGLSKMQTIIKKRDKEDPRTRIAHIKVLEGHAAIQWH